MSGSIASVLSNAASGLHASQAAIAVVSDDIANAGVAGFTAKQLDTAALVVGDHSLGVRTGLVSRSVDEALQAATWSSASDVGALAVRAGVLGAVNATQGKPGAGGSLADAVGALQSSFARLQSQPSAPTQQAAVAAAADTLARTLNATADAVASQRNNAQEQIVAAVGTLNAALQTVHDTTHALVAAVAGGTDTATLQDSRDAALQTLSGLLDLHYDKHANGDVAILGQNGLSIPLDSRFSTSPALLSPAARYAPGGAAVPGILLQSGNAATPAVDVTAQLSGGTLGELVQLRDATLPAATAGLDAFSAKLANQFSGQGLQLFTDGGVPPPLTDVAGLASQLAVNPAVAADPTLVRDGTPASANAAGLAGFSGIIDVVLSSSFGSSGTTPSLATDAQNFVSQQSAATARATGELATATAYQTTLAGRFADGSAVNVDHEMGLMIQLQNSYQANARVVQAAQAMFSALLGAVASVG